MNLTSEYFESTGITIFQPERGHRYGGESIELAEFCRVKEDSKIAEFGGGVGVILLQITARDHPAESVSVEIQKELHEIALHNVKYNGLSDKVKCICGDYREFAKNKKTYFDVIVANPPFFKKGRGRVSPVGSRATARHEIVSSIDELLDSANIALKKRGELYIVFPLEREIELNEKAKGRGFELNRTVLTKSRDAVLFAFVKI